MLDRLKKIIVNYAEIDPDDIKGDTKLIDDLDLTSFAVMGMMGDIETEFGITVVDEDELIDISTVDDVIEFIRMKQE